MIRPTVGRVVHYYPGADEQIHPSVNGQLHAAVIAHVHSERVVNLSVVDANGKQYAATSVRMVQEGDPFPDGPYCQWMAFQTGQAQNADTKGGLMDRVAAIESALLVNGVYGRDASGRVVLKG